MTLNPKAYTRLKNEFTFLIFHVGRRGEKFEDLYSDVHLISL